MQKHHKQDDGYRKFEMMDDSLKKHLGGGDAADLAQHQQKLADLACHWGKLVDVQKV